ncbi:TonB family protein [Mucilaginibacter lutimaris]|uniref:TonB family protein n=1 Tax=Mucilaginibacter lutimaris TaxID=931629 RepID=A0ABW2ZBT8_9SPHI
MKILKLTILFLLLTSSLFAQTNKKLAAELAAIYKDDQQYRVAAIAAAKKYGRGSKEDNELMKKQDIADRANLAKIETIISEYGYPGKTLVGAELSKVAFMVIQHNDTDAQEKYLPILTAAADKGELNPSLLPLMVDRLLTGKGQPQVYGTQLHETPGVGIQIFPIGDEAFVDVRRKKMGLPPLHQYLKQWGINYKVPSSTDNPNPKSLYYVAVPKDESPIMPVGGNDAIFSKLVYPEQAKAANITGFVTVELTVTGSGGTKNLSVVKGLGYGCDEEALRVMKEAKFTNKAGEDADIRIKVPFPYVKK